MWYWQKMPVFHFLTEPSLVWLWHREERRQTEQAVHPRLTKNYLVPSAPLSMRPSWSRSSYKSLSYQSWKVNASLCMNLQHLRRQYYFFYFDALDAGSLARVAMRASNVALSAAPDISFFSSKMASTSSSKPFTKCPRILATLKRKAVTGGISRIRS